MAFLLPEAAAAAGEAGAAGAATAGAEAATAGAGEAATEGAAAAGESSASSMSRNLTQGLARNAIGGSRTGHSFESRGVGGILSSAPTGSPEVDAARDMVNAGIGVAGPIGAAAMLLL
jgi:hypothetical protein